MRSPVHPSGTPTFPAPEISTKLMVFPFPIEVIENILVFCRVQEVIAFSKTCRLARIIIFDGSGLYLWRHLFLGHPFDNPRQSLKDIPANHDVAIDWRHELIKRLKAEQVARWSTSTPSCQFSRALEVFISMVQNVSHMTQGSNTLTQSFDLEWLERVLRASEFLNLEIDTPHPDAVLLARLRAYLSLSLDEHNDERSRPRIIPRRKRSRIYVYNVRNYFGYHPGPFLNNGNTDWIHVEHLVNVVVMNLRELPGKWSRIKPPLGLAATRPYSVPVNGMECPEDWARVAGTWRRYVCFMDFRDLYAFNFEVNREIDTSFFDCPNFREATRLVEMKLHLIDAENSRLRNYVWPTAAMKTINNRFPPIFFAGISRGYDEYAAPVEGVVHMTVDGVSTTTPETSRWWSEFYIFSGDYLITLRHRSDGAQVGNIASASGVVGVWTTEFRQKDDPVGPFWLWKVKDDFPVQLMEYSR